MEEENNMAFTNLTPVSFQKVGIRDGFWKKRIHAVCTETARLCIDQCEKTHRIDNFRRAAGWQAGGRPRRPAAPAPRRGKGAGRAPGYRTWDRLLSKKCFYNCL